MAQPLVDHLFRHQYGKMVAILSRYFGLNHIELIEDAVQDTFVKATLQWRNQLPDNPEAWLTRTAKNRMIDLLRQVQSEKMRVEKIDPESDLKEEVFLDHEIEDSQLRMIFVACHPSLHPKEQIAFALKAISGFSTVEIAAALLVKEETIRKRLNRARKTIVSHKIQFNFPPATEVKLRLDRVMEVIYLTFNEGFHSTQQKQLVREELCGESIRLCTLMLKKETYRSGALYSLFALMCFHTARLRGKTNDALELLDLQQQDRTTWYQPLIQLGFSALETSTSFADISGYHFEAAIAAEHVRAATFEETNWAMIQQWYEQLHDLSPSASSRLGLSIVHLQRAQFDQALSLLEEIHVKELEHRAYLYYGCYAEYFILTKQSEQAVQFLDEAISSATNELEIAYLTKKRSALWMTLRGEN